MIFWVRISKKVWFRICILVNNLVYCDKDINVEQETQLRRGNIGSKVNLESTRNQKCMN